MNKVRIDADKSLIDGLPVSFAVAVSAAHVLMQEIILVRSYIPFNGKVAGNPLNQNFDPS
jgi:hypothetical protein